MGKLKKRMVKKSLGFFTVSGPNAFRSFTEPRYSYGRVEPRRERKKEEEKEAERRRAMSRALNLDSEKEIFGSAIFFPKASWPSRGQRHRWGNKIFPTVRVQR